MRASEVLLGTSAWGVYRNGPGHHRVCRKTLSRWRTRTAAGLVGYGELVLATGARDLAIGFPGWNQPGVMGAAALERLLARYEAFAGKRVLFMAAATIWRCGPRCWRVSKGVEVAGLVEVRASPQGDAALVDAVRSAQIPFYLERCGGRGQGRPRRRRERAPALWRDDRCGYRGARHRPGSLDRTH